MIDGLEVGTKLQVKTKHKNKTLSKILSLLSITDTPSKSPRPKGQVVHQQSSNYPHSHSHSHRHHQMRQTPLLDAVQENGFVKIPGLLTPEQVDILRKACSRTVSQARKGQWPHVRAVPKQYPPWHDWGPGVNIWGVQHLMHPDLPDRDFFAEIYFSDAVLNVVKELLGLEPQFSTFTVSNDISQEAGRSDDKLVMELLNLLISPSDNRDFELCWHRDDIRPDASPAEEATQLAQKSPDGRQLHAQYNIALYDDSSLIVIPGSHRRIRSDIERHADPYESNMPGQILVPLRPGDAVFYDSNILHRGKYRGIDATKETGRMTLHGSVGLAGHGTERARQVLQHAVGEWVEKAGFGDAMPGYQRAENMRTRLMEMGSGRELGYSLVG